MGAEATCPTMYEGSRGSLPCEKCKDTSDSAAVTSYEQPTFKEYYINIQNKPQIYFVNKVNTNH